MSTITIDSNDVGPVTFAHILKIYNKATLSGKTNKLCLPAKDIISLCIKNTTIPVSFQKDERIRKQIMLYFVYIYSAESATNAAAANSEKISSRSMIYHGYHTVCDLMRHNRELREHVVALDYIITSEIKQLKQIRND